MWLYGVEQQAVTGPRDIPGEAGDQRKFAEQFTLLQLRSRVVGVDCGIVFQRARGKIGRPAGCDMRHHPALDSPCNATPPLSRIGPHAIVHALLFHHNDDLKTINRVQPSPVLRQTATGTIRVQPVREVTRFKPARKRWRPAIGHIPNWSL